MSSGRPAVPKPGRTRPVTAAQVHAYAAKAEDFAEAAASDFEAGRNIAATSLAIHAGINAADAVCGARLGARGQVKTTTRFSPCSARQDPTAPRSNATSAGSYRSRRRPSTSPTTSHHPSPPRRSSAPNAAPQ